MTKLFYLSYELFHQVRNDNEKPFCQFNHKLSSNFIIIFPVDKKMRKKENENIFPSDHEVPKRISFKML